jgi:hypothetical protein
MVRVHQDPPFMRVRLFWVTGIRSGSEALLALITVKRLSLFFKNLEEVCLRSLMRRDVNMGIDCIFDASISAEPWWVRVRAWSCYRWVEGLVHQVLIHTYDAVLLFGVRGVEKQSVVQVMVFERYRIKRLSAHGGCLGGNRR